MIGFCPVVVAFYSRALDTVLDVSRAAVEPVRAGRGAVACS